MAVARKTNGGTRQRARGGTVASFLLGKREIGVGEILDRLAVREVRALLRFGLTQRETAVLLGVSERTLVRQLSAAKPDERLSVAESDRLVRAARVLQFMPEAFDDVQKGLRWLRKPNLALGDRVPLELMQTEQGTLMVLRSLATIAYGGIV